jgi:hypothetical protein
MSRWQLDNVEEELDDEEIARILQEEEYEIARQQQREAQQRQQQQAKQPAATQRPTQAAPLRYGSGPVPPTSTDELLLLQSRCSAVSGTTVLKGSCYLYRNMFKFVCVERGKEVDVPIHVSTIELINPAFSLPSKDSKAAPRVVPTPRGAQQNVLQIYTQDKKIHTFFNFADDKTFHQIFNILSSVHKNKTALGPLPTMIPVPVAAATSPSPPATAAVSSQLAPSSTLAAAPVVGAPTVMAPPGYAMYPGMYPQAYPGAFPPQPYFMMPPPHGYPVQLASPPPAQPPQTADASVSDFHQLHQQMMRLQIQQQQQPTQQEASGQSPQPQLQPFMGAPYYYPYPPAAAAHPTPTSASDAPSTSGDQQQLSSLASVAPPPYYYPPAMPYAMPTGAEFQPYGAAPYPYPYAVPPPAQVPQQPQPPAQQQQQSQPPRPSGPPEDLLA